MAADGDTGVKKIQTQTYGGGGPAVVYDFGTSDPTHNYLSGAESGDYSGPNKDNVIFVKMIVGQNDRLRKFENPNTTTFILKEESTFGYQRAYQIKEVPNTEYYIVAVERTDGTTGVTAIHESVTLLEYRIAPIPIDFTKLTDPINRSFDYLDAQNYLVTVTTTKIVILVEDLLCYTTTDVINIPGTCKTCSLVFSKTSCLSCMTG